MGNIGRPVVLWMRPAVNYKDHHYTKRQQGAIWE
jgi:hypothetical protein